MASLGATHFSHQSLLEAITFTTLKHFSLDREVRNPYSHYSHYSSNLVLGVVDEGGLVGERACGPSYVGATTINNFASCCCTRTLAGDH